MKKIFKLKKWLTLEEASRRLTTTFEEDVTIADCLQLALDGHLVISALLSKSTYAIYAKKEIRTNREILFVCRGTNKGEDVYCDIMGVTFKADYLDAEKEHIERHGEIFRLRHGIYDLPMWGAEQLDVMHQFDIGQGRSPREFVDLEGAFLSLNGETVNIMNSFNEFEWITDEHGERKEFDKVLKKPVDFKSYHEFFYPDDGLRDVEFVFRRENIEQFERNALEDESPSLTMSESLLVIGSMLNALKNAQTSSKRWTQDSMKAEILENSKTIKSRTLDDYFSMANKSFKSSS
ncbi:MULTISPECIES: hypothetical protein [Yersinia]|uniref:hypothetical protein n=1 Tax=Yersinia TaxID=629 RepID=UPI0011A947A0|nr:hypothetical protein [Yersinia kristensenii]